MTLSALLFAVASSGQISATDLGIAYKNDQHIIYELPPGYSLVEVTDGDILTDHLVRVPLGFTTTLNVKHRDSAFSIEINQLKSAALPYISTKVEYHEHGATLCAEVMHTNLDVHWRIESDDVVPSNCILLSDDEATTHYAITASLGNGIQLFEYYVNEVTPPAAEEAFTCKLRMKDDYLKPYCQSSAEQIEATYFIAKGYENNSLARWPVSIDHKQATLVVKNRLRTQRFSIQRDSKQFEVVPFND